jgi:hypothetical protein
MGCCRMQDINSGNIRKYITGGRLYIAGILLLCIQVYLLNYSKSVYQCSLIFVTLASTISGTTAIWGRFKSLMGLGLAIVTSLTLLWKLPYYIDGRLVNGLVVASFSSLIISLYLSTSAFTRFYSRFGFVMANVLSLGVAAIIDGLMMSLFFIMNDNLSYQKIMDIFSRELSCKIIYGLIFSVIIFTAFKILKISNNSNYRFGSN